MTACLLSVARSTCHYSPAHCAQVILLNCVWILWKYVHPTLQKCKEKMHMFSRMSFKTV